MRRYEANGVKGTNMISTTHRKRGCERTASGCVAGLIKLSALLSALLAALLWRNPICARTTRTLKRWNGQHASTTTGVQLDHGLWP